MEAYTMEQCTEHLETVDKKYDVWRWMEASAVIWATRSEKGGEISLGPFSVYLADKQFSDFN